MAHVHFAAKVFSLPLKAEDHPHGVYTEQELYMVMAVIFITIFFDLDPAKSFPLGQATRDVTQQLGKMVEASVKGDKLTGWVSDIVDNIVHRENSPLTEYGAHVIKRLLDSGLTPSDVTWSQILPSVGAMVASQAQVVR